MWHVLLSELFNYTGHSPSLPQINYIIQRDKTKHDLASYLHGCACSPVLSTLDKAKSKGNLISWPGVEDINFSKTLVAKEATSKAHLTQER